MRKSKSNIGAATTSSVSSSEIGTSFNESIKDKEEATERTHYVPPTIGTLADFSSDFIIGFAQACYDNPECQANVLRNYYTKGKIEELVIKHQKNFFEDEIVNDASRLITIAMALTENYDKAHDDANRQIAEIMERHIPELQAQLNQLHKNK